MIADVTNNPQNCALTSLNQMGRFAETATTRPLCASLWPAAIRLGGFPKLPLQNCALTSLASLQSDWVDTPLRNCPNWKIINPIRALLGGSSLGGESHPLRGWGDRRRRGLPVPPPGASRARGPDLHPSTVRLPQGSTPMNTQAAAGTMPDLQPTPPAIPAARAILALDLGTTTGWASLVQGIVHSGTMTFRTGRYDGGGMRYLRFQTWLEGMADDTGGVAAIYFEEVRRHIGTDAAHIYGGFLATLTAWCERRRVAYQGVPVGTVKRFATGKGNADKQAVLTAMRTRGFNPADDNEADALAILLWAIETNGGLR
jgi:hypothetical protein